MSVHNLGRFNKLCKAVLHEMQGFLRTESSRDEQVNIENYLHTSFPSGDGYDLRKQYRSDGIFVVPAKARTDDNSRVTRMFFSSL
jgi:hypothetical protein